MMIRKLTEGDAFDMGPGDTRRIVHPGMGAKQLTLNYAVFEPGQAFAQHVHTLPTEDVMVVLKGRGVIRVEGVDHPIEEGDAIWVEAGARHGTINTGDSEMVIVSCQAPPDAALYTGEYAERADQGS
jgi:quercetin dioxygenase-like cupin family protein